MSITKQGQFIVKDIYEEILPSLINNAIWTTKSYYNDSGAITSSSNAKRIDNYYPILSNTEYNIQIADSSTNRIRIHEYTADKTWICQSVSTTNKTATWITNANAEYIRISLPINATNIILFSIDQNNNQIASITNKNNLIGNHIYEY